MPDNYYEILGVDRNATPEEIKRAYRRLAHQYHPDKAGGNEEKFKQANAAFQVLGDETKRAQYDRFGQTFDGSGPTGPHAPYTNVNFEDMADFANVGTIFEQFFGGAARAESARQRPAGQDINIDTAISFAESAAGIKKDISLRLYQTCSRCHGNAAEPGTPIENCLACRGSGTTSTTRQTILGIFTSRSVCAACNGEGKKPAAPCTQCHGEGRLIQDKALTVDIPGGIADGQTIRIARQGAAGLRGGPAGDLYVSVHVEPHPALYRQGNDVRYRTAITFADAALGTTVTVPTLAGDKEISIPPGTQPNTEIKLPGLGFPILDSSGIGHQIVTVAVNIPRKLSRRQRRILQDFKTTKGPLFG